MRQGSSPYVIHVLGVFKGRLPSSGSSAQLGLVMEVMERGSLASLQVTSSVESAKVMHLKFYLSNGTKSRCVISKMYYSLSIISKSISHFESV